jgi:hypothetical protein
MDCRTFHRKLEDYLESGMDFPSRFGMERHAKQCYPCEKDVAEALRLRQMARELRRVAAPPDFETSLLARIQSERSHHRFWKLQSFWLYGFDRLSWRVVSATASVVILIICAVTYLYLRPGIDRLSLQEESVASREANPPGSRMELPDLGSAAMEAPTISIGAASHLGRDEWASAIAEPADSEFVEYLVPVQGDRQLIIPLPRTIRMRYGQPSANYFIRNISH